MKMVDKLSKTLDMDNDNGLTMDNLHDLIDSAESFLRATASYSGAGVEEARARIKSQLESARAHAHKHRRSHAWRRASRMARSSGEYVQEHKWESMGAVAAVAAIVVGAYLGMRWMDDNR